MAVVDWVGLGGSSVVAEREREREARAAQQGTARTYDVTMYLLTEDVGGELAEADVAAAARLAVVEDAGHEGVLVQGDGGHGGEQREAERPPRPAQRVRERQHRRPHDRRRQVEPRVPPRPCKFTYY